MNFMIIIQRTARRHVMVQYLDVTQHKVWGAYIFTLSPEFSLRQTSEYIRSDWSIKKDLEYMFK